MNDLMTRRAAIARVACLLGGAVSVSTVAGVLAGCDRTPAATGGSTALDADRRELVATLGEHILPQTDTPGARAAQVEDFIDAMLTDYYAEPERERFLAGLVRVDERSERAFGVRFLDATPDQQRGLVELFNRRVYEEAPEVPAVPEVDSGSARGEAEAVQDASGAVDLDADWHPEDIGGQAFFRTLKELVLIGYYTSEVGATQELRTSPLGIWQADVPLSEIERAWA